MRDVRNLQLSRGIGNLRFMDIAATVNPATVHFRSLTEPSQVSVLEQNYEYDLLDPEKLLRKYVGREVTLMRNRQEGGSTRQEEVKATLLSYNTSPVWKIGNEIVTGLGADHIRFPELPDSLYSRPTLIWTVQNDGAARHRVEASYLARSLAWSADYVLTVARDDKAADLNGWVTLTNNSGTAFKNTKLQLVAGDLNRVRQQLNKMADMAAPAAAKAEERMAQESFSDYHLYTMGRKTTINNAQTKQVSLLEGTDVPVIKRYVVEGQNYYYHNYMHPGSPIKDSVAGLLPVPERGESGTRPADAGRRAARVSGGLKRRRAVRRRRPHHAHAERRNAERQDRQRLRRDLRAQADRFHEDRDQRLRIRIRDHAPQSQGERDQRRGQRACRRNVADDQLISRVDQDLGVGRAVQGPGRR